MTSQPQINKCRHFESGQGIKKVPRQIYCELPEVPFKRFNSKQKVIEFYSHLFKRFEFYAVRYFSSTANDSSYGSPCQQNNGTCFHGECKNTCICAAGFAGDDCESNINECASAPCQNQGNCTDLINSFTCTCPPGFTGPLCEINIDECASQPCQFNGTCTDGTNSVSFLPLGVTQ